MAPELDANVLTGPATAGSGPEIEQPGTPFKAGRKKTGGLKPGSRNKRSDLRDGLAEMCRSLTAGNLRFRQNLKRLCESPEIFDKPHLVAVLLSHGFGKPTPKTPAPDQRSPLLFVTQHPIGSYDPLAAKAAALAARKAERMLSEARPDAYEAPRPGDPEPDLVIIEPEPSTLATAAGRPGSR
jgi:hypothetical protein